jgi:hypothetical protein
VVRVRLPHASANRLHLNRLAWLYCTNWHNGTDCGPFYGLPL